jgi:hypothetical protein
MKSNPFQAFEKKFGSGSRYAVLSAKQFAKLRKTPLPSFYIDYLEKAGLKEYHQGFFWFVNPLERGLLCFLTKSEDYFPILRNAFGAFIVYLNSEYYLADPHTNQCGPMTDDLKLLVNWGLIKDDNLRDMFYADFFDYAFRKFGKLKPDEMFAFIPAPAFGGEFRNGNIQVVKMKEHLHFLAQL